MESNIIEFCGEVSEKCKKNYFKTLIKFLYIFSLITFIIVGGPLIAITVKFNLLFLIPLIIIFLFVCLISPLGVKSVSAAKIFPVKVIIENGEIAAINSEQALELDLESDGIDSFSVDGCFITSIKSISEVKKVVDYGEWYYILFNSKHVVTDYICQKDLITKGTIEEFEKLFEGKIKRQK